MDDIDPDNACTSSLENLINQIETTLKGGLSIKKANALTKEIETFPKSILKKFEQFETQSFLKDTMVPLRRKIRMGGAFSRRGFFMRTLMKKGRAPYTPTTFDAKLPFSRERTLLDKQLFQIDRSVIKANRWKHGLSSLIVLVCLVVESIWGGNFL